MTAIATVIGYAFLIAALIWALVPGMNFHVIFLDDKSTIEGRKRMREKVQKRIDGKTAKEAA